jgi:hypothetical protein
MPGLEFRFSEIVTLDRGVVMFLFFMFATLPKHYGQRIPL